MLILVSKGAFSYLHHVLPKSQQGILIAISAVFMALTVILVGVAVFLKSQGRVGKGSSILYQLPTPYHENFRINTKYMLIFCCIKL